AIRSAPGVQRLAANPLLLTILALIFYQGTRLPQRRVELYRLSVEALAQTWNLARSLSGRPIDLQLRGRPLDSRYVVNLLAPIALWVHETRPGGLVERAELEERLAHLFMEQEGVSREEATRLATDFTDLIREQSGLLVERGLGLYGFMHLTFEEYLAARAIADLVEEPEEVIGEYLYDPGWKEVILLAVGASPRREATRLVQSILEAPAEGEERGKNIVLAGQCLVDVGRDGVTGRLWERVVDELVGVMQDSSIMPRTRAEAGLLLGELNWLPEDLDAWCKIPAGRVTIEGKTKEVETFWIAKYPVTNSQFARFVEAGGYSQERYWSREGWHWHRGAQAVRPRYWDDARFNNPLQPVVGVSWYEAEAYCHWLTERLGEAGKLAEGGKVRLPTEEEWLLAAQGHESRKYPWGERFDPALGNTAESKLGQTTPVCMYPDGLSPYGVWDMAGNVWEWTGSWYDEETKEAPVLRGGSWGLNRGSARCASRFRGKPAYWSTDIGFRCARSFSSK
ncbi:MAG: formylglycine-generating enzyme family protein, partial [Anaerolineae bacterium]